MSEKHRFQVSGKSECKPSYALPHHQPPLPPNSEETPDGIELKIWKRWKAIRSNVTKNDTDTDINVDGEIQIYTRYLQSKSQRPTWRNMIKHVLPLYIHQPPSAVTSCCVPTPLPDRSASATVASLLFLKYSEHT